ncbi:MAG: cysteine desulfurase [Bacteroidetes bacterium]|nr:cysteine desulfurase [Bacteroidota bacterium]
MQRIYLDNAATTPLDPIVLDAMMPYMQDKFGNPSTIYSYGRETRLAIENARKSVAKILNAHPAEIFFTSGGTESSNTAIFGAVRDLGCTHIITSAIEHHATLHPIEYLEKKKEATVNYVKLKEKGHIDLADLEYQLQQISPQKVLVSLIHANNEIGNKISLHEVGEICNRYGAIFHSDTVQTVGHFPFDLRNTPVHFITGSAHKFYGPKGVGLLYVNENIRIHPFMMGGGQERNMRAGTENLYGIVGFAKALELATASMETVGQYLRELKLFMLEALQQNFPQLIINGDPTGFSNDTVLNVGFPKNEKTEMLLMNLDMAGICVSGGSACTSGAAKGSHVIETIHPGKEIIPVRFSFSKHNTKEEIVRVIQELKRHA